MKAIEPVVCLCVMCVTALVAGCSSGLNREKEETANAAYGIVVQPVKGGVEMRMLETALFDPDDAQIRPASMDVIERAATLLKRSTRPVLIEGHTDNEGSRAYNDALSEARAESVARELIARGVPAARIRAKGMAYLRPIASNSTPEGRARNRRVEMLVKTENEETLLGAKPVMLPPLPR
ncbi:outer membrane protein OmpA-like peptidoglycan-associated protein [Paraburkholderia sp. BL8N3]|nr:OmpA family protein [Paraburkholderia sp. BL8N3]TCK38124.1 outer membrane protein OmpA-like peptidoglycan-associated protein [Paraburkholderia sp. BL8N3]